ncbi:MAG: homocysteine S-methyltransferase family protein, partial [Myxococcota bacterium]|nr:homocysteine S-methyltransferase family protein [Myxococcota bacterium]
ARVHARYVEAGVDALTANTFRTQARTLAGAGRDPGADAAWTAQAVGLARRAADEAPSGRRVFVLGSAPPLEDCYAPARVPPDDALAREHARHAANLVAAGVDAILVETMNCVREAVAALRAAREAGVEAWVSFVCWEGDRLLSGEPLAEALDAVAPLAPLLVGVNCLPPRAVPGCLPALRAAGRPFGVYANLGAPLDDGGFRCADDAPPGPFAEAAASWADAGARAVGGCCGTTAAHLRAVVERLRPGP